MHIRLKSFFLFSIKPDEQTKTRMTPSYLFISLSLLDWGSVSYSITIQWSPALSKLMLFPDNYWVTRRARTMVANLERPKQALACEQMLLNISWNLLCNTTIMYKLQVFHLTSVLICILNYQKYSIHRWNMKRARRDRKLSKKKE